MFSETLIQLKMDTDFFRNEELKLCKTQKEKDILLDRWAYIDAQQKIADAIRDSSNNRPRFLGIF